MNEYVEGNWWEKEFDSNLEFRDGGERCLLRRTSSVPRNCSGSVATVLLVGGRMTEQNMQCLQDST